MKSPPFLYHFTAKKNLSSISSKGLIPKQPDEWRRLIPTRFRNERIVWLNGVQSPRANIRVDVEMLDIRKLHKLTNKQVDWWFYTGVISPQALDVI